MLVRLVLSRLQSLDRAADDVGWEFNKMNFGFGRPSDERLALREVKRDLLEPLEQVYLASYASPQMKADITNLCKKIISYYRTMLQEETWLSDATRQMALRKLDHMVIHAAYPNKFYDYGSLDISQIPSGRLSASASCLPWNGPLTGWIPRWIRMTGTRTSSSATLPIILWTIPSTSWWVS